MSKVEVGWTGMREQIRKAILRPLERAYLEHDEGYNPDTVGECADEVIAVFLSVLTGQPVTVASHPEIIAPARFVIDNTVTR